MFGHKPHSLEQLTVATKSGFVVHYTCNAPSLKVLKRYGIETMGEAFGCADDREVVKIPEKLYKRFGYKIGGDLRAVSEHLLRDIERR